MKRLILCTTCSSEFLSEAALQNLDAARRSGFLRRRGRCDRCDRVLPEKTLVIAWSVLEKHEFEVDEEDISHWEHAVIEEGGVV